MENGAPVTDLELIRRAQQGDATAFEALVRGHTASVRRFAFGFTRNWSDADDLAQEALIKAYRALGSFRGDSAFSTWLFRITRNVCVDAGRSRAGRQRASEDLLEDGTAESPSEERPDEVALRREREARLWAAVRELPAEFRAAIILFDIEGMTYEEVAAIEKVPIGTVRSRLSRGRERLRALVAAQESPAPGTSPALSPSNFNREPSHCEASAPESPTLESKDATRAEPTA